MSLSPMKTLNFQSQNTHLDLIWYILDSHCTHKNEVLHDVWEFVGIPKISLSLPKLMLMQEKQNRGSYDGLRFAHEWPSAFTMFLRSLLNFRTVWGLLNCVSMRHQFQNSVRPTLGRSWRSGRIEKVQASCAGDREVGFPVELDREVSTYTVDTCCFLAWHSAFIGHDKESFLKC